MGIDIELIIDNEILGNLQAPYGDKFVNIIYQLFDFLDNFDEKHKLTKENLEYMRNKIDEFVKNPTLEYKPTEKQKENPFAMKNDAQMQEMIIGCLYKGGLIDSKENCYPIKINENKELNCISEEDIEDLENFYEIIDDNLDMGKEVILYISY